MLPERYVDDTTFHETVSDLLKARTPDEIMTMLGERFNVWPQAIEKKVLISAIEERGLIAPEHIA